MNINIDRLEKNLQELGKIGRNAGGGIDRALGSQADREARQWILSYWKSHLNVDIRIDGIANLWAFAAGTEPLPPIVFGSHHDAVPDGGMFDGALGVLIATEILETLQENGVKTRHPFGLVSFTGEEPNPFQVSTLGSKVLSGRLTRADLERLRNRIDGSDLQSCMQQIGGDITRADDIRIQPEQIRAFLECHIEQGCRLEEKGLHTAAVSCITGIYREDIVFTGEANHAGTTTMKRRKDAFNAAAEFSLAFEKLLQERASDDVVGTVNNLTMMPNAVGIVPGTVTLTMEIRTCSENVTHEIARAMDAVCEKIQRERGVEIRRRLNLDQPPMPMDTQVQHFVQEAMLETGEGNQVLVSMAGHDAANMQRVTKSGMIFTRSVGGKSHCPQEYTEPESIWCTGNAMLLALLKMDEGLD